MHTMKSGAAAFAAGAIAILFSSTAAAANGNMCVRDKPPPQATPVNEQLMEQMEGSYRLSNGQRLKLEGAGNRMSVDFGRRRISLDQIGEHHFVSRDGSVDLSYRPDRDEIAVRYPADGNGRYVKAC